MRDGTLIPLLNNHGEIINAHAGQLGTHQQALAYLSTRQKAEEQVRTANRFSLLWTPLREVFAPGSFKAAVDAAQKALLNPPAPIRPHPAKIEVKPVTEANTRETR